MPPRWGAWGAIRWIRKVPNDGQPRGTGHAPEVAFAWRNERGAKRNLRRVDRGQARRPAGANDGLAQQPGNGAACHAPRRRAALRHDLSGKVVGDRDPRYRAALDRALRMVRA